MAFLCTMSLCAQAKMPIVKDGNFYGSLSGGIGLTPDIYYPVRNNIFSGRGSVDFNTAYNMFGHIGYRMGSVRFEGALGYISGDIHNVKGHNITTTPGANAALAGNIFVQPVPPQTYVATGPIASPTIAISPTGNSNVITLMVNGYYDFEMFHPEFAPYVGVGVGYARYKGTVRAPNFIISTLPAGQSGPLLASNLSNLPGAAGTTFVSNKLTINARNNLFSFDIKDNLFAYQLIGGLRYRFTKTIDGFVEYRYFRTSNIKILNAPYQTHLLNVGITAHLT